MKEPYTEGLASHGDPESCAGTRKGAGEALTGAHMGGVLSRETNPIRGRRCHTNRMATYLCALGRVHRYPARSETSSTCGNSMRENREIPCSARDDVKAEGWKRTESPWSRVPRDGKCGEGDPRHRSSLEPSPGPCWEGRRPHASDVRTREVGQANSTYEAAEQGGATYCGGGGGKGPDQGERGRAKHASDAEPGTVCQMALDCVRQAPLRSFWPE